MSAVRTAGAARANALWHSGTPTGSFLIVHAYNCSAYLHIAHGHIYTSLCQHRHHAFTVARERAFLRHHDSHQCMLRARIIAASLWAVHAHTLTAHTSAHMYSWDLATTMTSADVSKPHG
eukprot:6175810-Pleurochrysis_carterae.AAC.2